MQYRPEPLRESDRYRGRRRAPTPARGRYAAVLTTAFVGAGVVALGAGAGIKDAKVDALVADTSVAEAASLRDSAGNAPARRDRGLATSTNSLASAPWVLPLRGYKLTSPFGQRWGVLHAGIDIGGVREGTPFAAVHDGTVILCRNNGGYGLNVQIDHGDGMVTIYGHANKLLCKEGQQVKAGDIIGWVGNTGHSFGPHLHLEIRINGVPNSPIPFFKERGVDFNMETEAVYGVDG